MPIYELMYEKEEEVLWSYDETGNFVMGTMNKMGVTQGCVLVMFLFCLTMAPVYTRRRVAVGDEGVLYTYCDDSYILAHVNKMAEVMRTMPPASSAKSA